MAKKKATKTGSKKKKSQKSPKVAPAAEKKTEKKIQKPVETAKPITIPVVGAVVDTKELIYQMAGEEKQFLRPISKTGDINLPREVQEKLTQAIYNQRLLFNVLESLKPRQLIEAQKLVWREVIEKSEDVLGQRLERQMITSKMMPSSTYQYMVGCDYPDEWCRAYVCINSDPGCASRKIKEQIAVMVRFFERRERRKGNIRDFSRRYLQSLVKKNKLLGAVLIDSIGVPIAIAFDVESLSADDKTNLTKSITESMYAYLTNFDGNLRVYDIDLQKDKKPLAINCNSFEAMDEVLTFGFVGKKEFNYLPVFKQAFQTVSRIIREEMEVS